MPLPLPNLDTRRWTDLVDEGRALIPRYAPTWTDYNVHDPGITLIELLAWLVERAMYQVNRIPDRHRYKFLELEGITPFPPRPAHVALAVTLKSGTGTLALPAGLEFHTAGLPYRTRWAITLTDAQLVAVQVYDGTLYLDRTRALADALPFPAFGPNPSSATSPALLLGFNEPLPKGQTVTLYIRIQGEIPGERGRLMHDAADSAADCLPAPPSIPCPSSSISSSPPPVPAPPGLPAYHSARLVWEVMTATGWVALTGVVDDTRALTLDGTVRLTVPVDMTPQSIGAVAAKCYYVRARLASGQYDAAPVLIGATINGLLAEQTAPACQQFPIAAGVVPTGTITAGMVTPLTVTLDATGTVQQLGVALASSPNPPVRVVAYTAPTTTTAGAITLALRWIGTGTGFPDQLFPLADHPIAHGQVAIFALGAPTWQPWTVRQDFDASTNTDATIVVDNTEATARAGNGVHGEVVPTGTPMVAAFDTTHADTGHVSAAQSWQLGRGTWNRALLGADPSTIAPLLTSITNPAASVGGSAEETLSHAIGRAGALLWAHELLIGLCPTGSCPTLDQIDPSIVRASPMPTRAATTLDFERIAVGVPGTRVQRARAWANVDPRYPGLDAPGAVTLIIVPELPVGMPQPSAGLRRVISRYLDRRRVLCTRLIVVGPTYVVASITAQVQALAGANPATVQSAVVAALTAFIDPLAGGPAGLGWPFGRDVYSNEILAVIDRVSGVDHVLSLSMSADGGAADCGNICVAPTALAASGTHTITVLGV